MGETAIENRKVEKLSNTVRRQIIRGTLRPGQVLQSERQLSREWDLSHASVRKILGQLHHDGLVVRKHGRGTYVADPLPPRIAQGIAYVLNYTLTPSMHYAAMELFHGFSGRCLEVGFKPQFEQLPPNVDEAAFRAYSLGGLSDAAGVIFLPFPDNMSVWCRRLVDQYAYAETPAVKVCWAGQFLWERGQPSVNYDRRLMGRMATEHAISAGYRRLAYLAPISHGINEESRLGGFLDALRAHHLELGVDLLQETDKTLDTTRRAVKAMMGCASPPEAILCCTDRVGGLVIQALTELGKAVPNDVAVVACTSGGENIDVFPISITSAVSPLRSAGRRAAELLRDLIDGKPAPEHPVLVEPEFFMGESCPVRRPSDRSNSNTKRGT